MRTQVYAADDIGDDIGDGRLVELNVKRSNMRLTVTVTIESLNQPLRVRSFTSIVDSITSIPPDDYSSFATVVKQYLHTYEWACAYAPRFRLCGRRIY